MGHDMRQLITVTSESMENGNATCTNQAIIDINDIKEKITGTILTATGAYTITWPWLDTPSVIFLELDKESTVRIVHAGNTDTIYGCKMLLLQNQYFSEIQIPTMGVTAHFEVYGT